ncbi:homogentisate 1,2-dioxygenase [Indioceanicola profundi]|uniref:homogentisate 1,2-dioxygenase n=1 Tax=Indioceanicola profundi TaxID=2220096 RepID=UPI000E6AB443|nr:homogentisate 1,2-dioxygenase [Indioceanicola profundi]
MRRYIQFPKVEGTASRQAHANLPEGTYEREIGKEGFFGPATHMYHRNPPTGWLSWEGPLRPRAFDVVKELEGGATPWAAREFLYNAHCRMRIWKCDAPMDHLVRNGDGDELMFVHEGAGELFTDYGHLSVTAGDYVMLPRSTMWRLSPTSPVTALLIEATGSSYQLPDRGIVGPHAVFDPAMLDTPAIDDAFLSQQSETGPDGVWKVLIKRRHALSTVTYPFNPLDAVGWKGDLAPVRLNVKDIRPLMSHRYHLPPSAHTTFVANRFVVCTFAPRPFETDENAIKIPFFHNNDDYDEVLFYHAGDFFSRDNIKAGMVTFHPCGFTHGPHPKALTKMLKQTKPATDEYAVMIDTRDALEVAELPAGVELESYADSWRVK